MNEATWAALAATLTLLGLVWTWVAYQRRGAVAALRALGFTTLPIAAWLTGTLELATEITGSVTDWATSLVFNPVTWSGVGLAGFGLVLIVVSGFLRDRQLARGGARPAAALPTEAAGRSARRLRATPSTSAPAAGTVGSDNDDDDIEAILKRHGIT